MFQNKGKEYPYKTVRNPFIPQEIINNMNKENQSSGIISYETACQLLLDSMRLNGYSDADIITLADRIRSDEEFTESLLKSIRNI